MIRTSFHRVKGRGFTLTELLVAITIIVLVIGMAIPLVNSFRGSRSIEAGENVISSVIQRARARAIGLQERRGAFFYVDPATGKTAATYVKTDESAQTEYVQILVDSDIDAVEFLPAGVGAAFLAPGAGATTEYRPYGLILFDGLGRIETRWFVFPQEAATTSYPDNTLKNRCGFPVARTDNAVSQAGMMLFDQQLFASAPTNTPPTKRTYSGVELIFAYSADQKKWFDQNGAAFLINRYNGTLLRGD